jgi:pimeloyl-ACP methyl ester carboxylesterase
LAEQAAVYFRGTFNDGRYFCICGGDRMTAPLSSITPGTGQWIWTNPFGRIPTTQYNIGSTTEIDTYRFQADVTGTYTITVSGGTLDSMLRIYDSNGNTLGAGPIDSANAGGTETAIRTLTGGNWYYVGVGGFGTSTGTYNLTIDGPAPFINNITTDAPTYSGSFTGAAISPAGDIDWFKLTAPAGTTSLSFSTSGLSASLDTSLQFLDAAGNSLLGVVNNAGAGLGDAVFSTPTAANATYYIGVTSLGSGNYNLNVDFNPDQSLSVLSIAPLSADKAEGNNQTTAFTFQVSRTGSASGTSTVHWAVGFNQSPSADAADFSGGIIPSGDLTWGPNDTSSRTISVGVNGDLTYEGDLPEHFVVTLSGQTGATLGTSTANGSIQNDDVAPQPAVLSISALSADKLEGNNQTTAFTFSVTHTGDTSASSSVHWAIGANQSPAADASDFIGATSGTLNWAIGDSNSKIITIGVNGDTTYEGDLPEHFTVNLSNASGATIGTATANGSIQNDDLGNSVTGTVQGLDTQIGSTRVPATSVTLHRIDSNLPIDPTLQTWIVIHGRSENFDPNTVMANLANEIDAVTGTAQVLTVDWRDGANPIGLDNISLDFHGETYIRPIAQWLAGLFAGDGLTGSRINIVGHSWGGVMAAELATAMNGVNSIVALDPAADATPLQGGTNYDTDNIRFDTYSSFAWAFYSPDGGPVLNLIHPGNAQTAITADEAFVVKNSSHTGVVSMFTNMLAGVGSNVSQYFQLSQLLDDAVHQSHLAAPWAQNQYDDNGTRSASGGFEAVIDTTGGGIIPQIINYVPVLAPEITVSANAVNIADGDTTPSSTDLTDFGSATQGGSIVQHTFTVNNTGTGTLTTSGLLVPAGYTVVEGLSSSISAGNFDTFTIRLDTSSTGIKNGQISFTTNDSDENPFNFSITGTVNATPAPEIAVSGGSANIPDGDLSPTSFDGTDFGTVAQGATLDRVFTVSNIGSGTLTTSGLLVPAGFSLVEPLSSSITAGNFDTFTVRLDTSSTGSKSGQISFTTNDGDENPFNFQIAGAVSATPVPEIAVSGGGTNILDGDLSPTGADGTDFGTPAQGVIVDRVFTVSNIGTATLTTSGLLLPAGYTLVEGLSPSIPAGNSDTFTVRLDTSSVGTKTGQISFTTNDSDENPFNFSVTGAVSETPLSQPDLTVSNLSIAQASAQPGQTITIDYDLNNIGSVDAAGFELGFYISADATVDKNDELFAYSPNASQLANSSTHHHGTAPLPADLTPGLTYFVGIIADDTDVIPNELSENNNASNVVSIAVTSAGGAQADLTASNAVLDRAGISYTINNTSTVATAASTTGIYLSADSTITTSDTLLTTYASPALAGGGSDFEASSLSFPTNLTPGTYFVGVIADHNARIAENNETNNASGGVPIILGNNSANTLNGTIGNDIILGLAGNDILVGDGQASVSGDITSALQSTIVQFDGSGFDATRVQNASVVKTASGYALLYAGLTFGNNYQVGLATSSDGANWSKFSDSPVISNGGSQSWASFRELPATLMLDNGVYKLWFNGDNSNLSSDPGFKSGFGYATSTDGINWSFDANNPIRVELNSPSGNGIDLDEVVKLNGQYIAYYVNHNPSGDVLNYAISTDGIHFSNDAPLGVPGGYALLAATTANISGTNTVFAVLQDSSGVDHYATSTDGANFTIGGIVNVPSNFNITDVLFDGSQIKFFGNNDVGNVNWGFGNTNIEYATAAVSSLGVSNGALGGNDILDGGPGSDMLTGGPGNDTLDGGTGTDTAIYSGLRSDYLITRVDSGSIQIADTRAGSPDGSDIVSNVQNFQFADHTYAFDQFFPSALYPTAAFSLANFAPDAGGWVNDTIYPRELADVNHDGMVDIVGFGEGGVYVALAKEGGSFGPSSFTLANFAPSAGGWINNTIYPRELADVDGDGVPDIVGFGESGVYVALATGDGSFGSSSFKLANFAPGAGGWSNNSIYARELADVDGDGKADIVGFGQDGVYVALATGGGSFGPSAFKLANFAPGAGGWTNNDQFPRFLADVNGDHMADIVGFGDGGVYVALATGGGSFGPSSFQLANFGPSAGGWINQNIYPRELADVNGDHMADIIGFGEGGVYVALATGGGSFGPSSLQIANFGPSAGGWTSENTYPRLLADVNHDGAADIVGFGQNGVYEALSNGFHLI